MPGLMGLKLSKSRLGSRGHHLPHVYSPPKSPDLKPNKNLWDVQNKILYSGFTLPSSIQDLVEK